MGGKFDEAAHGGDHTSVGKFIKAAFMLLLFFLDIYFPSIVSAIHEKVLV